MVYGASLRRYSGVSGNGGRRKKLKKAILHEQKPNDPNVIIALQLYQSCAGPLNSILHYPEEGSVLDQPAKIIDFFQKIQYYITESMDEETNKNSVQTPDPEQEAQNFEERMSQLKGN